MVLKAILLCFGGTGSDSVAPDDGPFLGRPAQQCEGAAFTSEVDFPARTRTGSQAVNVQTRGNFGQDGEVWGPLPSGAPYAATNYRGDGSLEISCGNDDTARERPAYWRDHMICSGMPSAVTIFSLRGHVLHQNPASAIYLGNRLGKGINAACQQEEDVLALVFMYEPEKLDQLLTEVMADGRGRWRGIIRVPPSLAALGQLHQKPVLGPNSAPLRGPILVDTSSTSTLKISTSLQAHQESLFDVGEAVEPQLMLGEVQQPSARRGHLPALFSSSRAKTAPFNEALQGAAPAMDISTGMQLVGSSIRRRSIAAATIASMPSTPPEAGRPALLRSLTQAVSALMGEPDVQCRTKAAVAADFREAHAGCGGLESGPASVLPGPVAAVAPGRSEDDGQRTSMAVPLAVGAASPTGHLTAAANCTSAGATATTSIDTLGHTAPQTSASQNTVSCSRALNTSNGSFGTLAPHTRASGGVLAAADSPPPRATALVMHPRVDVFLDSSRPSCRTVASCLGGIPEASAARVSGTLTAFAVCPSGGGDGCVDAVAMNVGASAMSEACSSRRSWDSCGNPLATSTFGLALSRPLDGAAAAATASPPPGTAAITPPAASAGDSSASGTATPQGLARVVELSPRRPFSGKRSSSLMRSVPHTSTTVLGRTSFAASRPTVPATGVGVGLPIQQLASRTPTSLGNGASTSAHSRVLAFASSLRNAPTAAQLLAEGNRRGSFQASSRTYLDALGGAADATRLAGQPRSIDVSSGYSGAPPATRAFLRSRPSVDFVQLRGRLYNMRPRSLAAPAVQDRLCGPVAGTAARAPAAGGMAAAGQELDQDGDHIVMDENAADGDGGNMPTAGLKAARRSGKEHRNEQGGPPEPEGGGVGAAAGAAPAQRPAWYGCHSAKAVLGTDWCSTPDGGRPQPQQSTAAGPAVAGASNLLPGGDMSTRQQQQEQLHQQRQQLLLLGAAVDSPVKAEQRGDVAVVMAADTEGAAGRQPSYGEPDVPGGARSAPGPDAPDPDLLPCEHLPSPPQAQQQQQRGESPVLELQRNLQPPLPQQQQQQSLRELAAQRYLRDRAQPQLQSAPAPRAASAEVECWHEVWAARGVDPVTGEDVVVVSQHDVTAKVVAERHLALVMEAEHRLLEQLFPKHILTHITEEWIAEAERSALAPLTPGAAIGGAAAEPGPETTGAGARRVETRPGFQRLPQPLQVQPQEWRPVVRDCNALATCHSSVTLLFADIRGFTPMCEQVAPSAVMTMLNDLFSRFDSMLDKFGVFKVETIGDCYFVAGGLIHEDEDGMAAVRETSKGDPLHAEKVFMFAKAMLAAAREVRMPTSGQPVQVRIGIHSGPVVSGVVGTRMPRFCLFGDTVNTTSRMESTGVPGAIHASASAYALLRSEAWEPTGGIEVKGKGFMQTYLWRPFLGGDEQCNSLQVPACAATAAAAAAAVMNAGGVPPPASPAALLQVFGRLSLVTHISQGPSTSSACGRQKRVVPVGSVAAGHSRLRESGAAALNESGSHRNGGGTMGDDSHVPMDELDNSEQLIAMLLDHAD